MIGDDPVAGAMLALSRNAGRLDGGGNQRPEQVRIIIVVLALQQRRNALQTHAGIDRRTRQVDTLFLRQLLILHEDEVPDFDETVAILFRRTGRSTPDMIAMVVEDFRTGTAGTGIAHRPEIVAGRNADDAVIGKTGDLLPEIKGLIVGMINRDQQAVAVDAEFLGDQVPGMGDRFFLEIIAEGEVTEHFEEGMVTGGITDIVEIVMLAAGAHAFLRRCRRGIGTAFKTGEDVFELHHAGIGEHQCRIVARHQRAGGHYLVSVLLEVVEKGRPNFIHTAHAHTPLTAGVHHRHRK